METFKIRKAVLTGLKATGGNVKTDAASEVFRGQCIICKDNSVAPPVNVLPPLHKGVITAAYKQASIAEVAQIAFIGRLAETIAANTRYRIEIENNADYETEKKDPFRYAVTSDSTLSGTAATDRENVYSALVTKINNYAGNKVLAENVRSVAFTLGKDAVPVVGETVTQETSGITARVVAVDVTAGTITGADGAGTIYLSNFSDEASWSAAAKTLTGGTSVFVCTTNAVLTTGVGIAIIDDGDYHAPRPNSGRTKSYIGLTQGFLTATVEAGTTALTAGAVGLVSGLAGVYSQGIGTRMLRDVPVFTPDGVFLISGEAWMESEDAPVSGKTYTTFIFEHNPNPSMTNITGYGMHGPSWYVLWADETNGTYLAALESAIESALGITIA